MRREELVLALFDAVRDGNIGRVASLIDEHPFETLDDMRNESGRTLLGIATEQRHTELAEFLSEHELSNDPSPEHNFQHMTGYNSWTPGSYQNHIHHHHHHHHYYIQNHRLGIPREFTPTRAEQQAIGRLRRRNTPPWWA
jgi:hypothetical protein